MDNKLQQLTQQLYNEGIQKAEIEAAAIVQQARQKAEAIVTQAEAEKQVLLDQAQKEAQQLTQRTHAELRMVINQALQKLKQDIAQLIQLKTINQPIAQTLQDPQYLSAVLLAVVSGIYPDPSGQLTVQLSPATEQSLLHYLRSQIAQLLHTEPVIHTNANLKAGFKIGKTDDNYVLSFTDEDFATFIAQFMYPEIAQIFKDPPSHE